MLILAFGSVLLGTVLGRFFKAWVLVPASALIFAIVFAGFTNYEHGLPGALLGVIVSVTCLQIGYVSGCLPGVIRDGWRRLKIPREIPREPSQTAAARHQQLF